MDYKSQATVSDIKQKVTESLSGCFLKGTPQMAVKWLKGFRCQVGIPNEVFRLGCMEDLTSFKMGHTFSRIWETLFKAYLLESPSQYKTEFSIGSYDVIWPGEGHLLRNSAERRHSIQNGSSKTFRLSQVISQQALLTIYCEMHLSWC